MPSTSSNIKPTNSTTAKPKPRPRPRTSPSAQSGREGQLQPKGKEAERQGMSKNVKETLARTDKVYMREEEEESSSGPSQSQSEVVEELSDEEMRDLFGSYEESTSSESGSETEDDEDELQDKKETAGHSVPDEEETEDEDEGEILVPNSSDPQQRKTIYPDLTSVPKAYQKLEPKKSKDRVHPPVESGSKPEKKAILEPKQASSSSVRGELRVGGFHPHPRPSQPHSKEAEQSKFSIVDKASSTSASTTAKLHPNPYIRLSLSNPQAQPVDAAVPSAPPTASTGSRTTRPSLSRPKPKTRGRHLAVDDDDPFVSDMDVDAGGLSTNLAVSKPPVEARASTSASTSALPEPPVLVVGGMRNELRRARPSAGGVSGKKRSADFDSSSSSDDGHRAKGGNVRSRLAKRARLDEGDIPTSTHIPVQTSKSAVTASPQKAATRPTAKPSTVRNEDSAQASMSTETRSQPRAQKQTTNLPTSTPRSLGPRGSITITSQHSGTKSVGQGKRGSPMRLGKSKKSEISVAAPHPPPLHEADVFQSNGYRDPGRLPGERTTGEKGKGKEKAKLFPETQTRPFRPARISGSDDVSVDDGEKRGIPELDLSLTIKKRKRRSSRIRDGDVLTGRASETGTHTRRATSSRPKSRLSTITLPPVPPLSPDSLHLLADQFATFEGARFGFDKQVVLNTFRELKDMEKTRQALRELRDKSAAAAVGIVKRLRGEGSDGHMSGEEEEKEEEGHGDDDDDDDSDAHHKNRTIPRQPRQSTSGLRYRPPSPSVLQQLAEAPYSPPEKTRAGRYTRLVREGRVQEALESEGRRMSAVSGGSTGGRRSGSGRHRERTRQSVGTGREPEWASPTPTFAGSQREVDEDDMYVDEPLVIEKRPSRPPTSASPSESGRSIRGGEWEGSGDEDEDERQDEGQGRVHTRHRMGREAQEQRQPSRNTTTTSSGLTAPPPGQPRPPRFLSPSATSSESQTKEKPKESSESAGGWRSFLPWPLRGLSRSPSKPSVQVDVNESSAEDTEVVGKDKMHEEGDEYLKGETVESGPEERRSSSPLFPRSTTDSPSAPRSPSSPETLDDLIITPEDLLAKDRMHVLANERKWAELNEAEKQLQDPDVSILWRLEWIGRRVAELDGEE